MSFASWCDKLTPLIETTPHRNAHRSNVEMETREERLELPSEARKIVVVVGSETVGIRRRDEAQGVCQPVVHECNCYRRSESIARSEDEEAEAHPEELRLEM